ncbi:MAG: hypothetical protein ACI9NY_001590, partial [Kiritimatiellia bacterium]
MNELIKSKETSVWLLLMMITMGSWVLGANHSILFNTPANEAAVLMALAFFKVRLIIRYFMEVRHAPKMLKLSCECWLWCSCLITL